MNQYVYIQVCRPCQEFVPKPSFLLCWLYSWVGFFLLVKLQFHCISSDLSNPSEDIFPLLIEIIANILSLVFSLPNWVMS